MRVRGDAASTWLSGGGLRHSTRLVRCTGGCAACARDGGGGKGLARRVAAELGGMLLGMDLRSGVLLRPGVACPGVCSTAVEGSCEEAM